MNRSILASLAAFLLAASGTAALAADMTPAATKAASEDAATAHDHRVATREARMTEALNLLEAKGYGTFRDFRADGKNFDATVRQDGKSFTVVVDPDAGHITQRS